jgi:hypothetical protein
VRRSAWCGRLRAVEFDSRGPAEPPAFLARLALGRLDRLSFRNRAVEPAEVRVLAAGPLFGRLVALRFDRPGARTGYVVAEALARDGARSALRELHLFGCQVPVPALAALLRSPAVAAVHTLGLGGDLIASPLKFAAIADVAAPGLQVLDLSDESPSAEALEALTLSPVARGLRRLDLARSSLNRDRTRVLAGGAFENLRVLSLYGNSARNEGVTALARAPHLAGLLALDLGFTQVGDEGLRALLDSPLADGLVLLNLAGSPASAEMKHVIKEKMGDRVRL